RGSSSTPSRCSPSRVASCSRTSSSRREGGAHVSIGNHAVSMPNEILTAAIDELAARRDLSAEQTAGVLAEIMHGEASEIQIAGFLIALRAKGETVEELAGLAETMRVLAAHVPTERTDLLDTSGTGGGRSS